MVRMLLILVATAILLSPAIVQADTVLRFAHSNAPSSPKGKGADKFAKLVKTYTNGQVAVQVFPNSQLGSNREVFSSTRSGAVQMSITPYSILADVVPEMSIYIAGYLFQNFGQEQKILNNAKLGQKWKTELLNKSGLRILCTYLYGSRDLTTASTPVKSPADLKGLKIRAVPQPMSMAVIRGLGGTPTSIPIAGVFQALKQGVVDGQENPLPTINSQHFYEVQKYLMMTKHQLIVEPYIINENAWQSLDKNKQAAIQRAANKACALTTRLTRQQEASLVKKFKKTGMTVITKTDGLDISAFRSSVRDKMKHTFEGKVWPKGTIQKVEALLRK
jgi:tripartite ATP-independent transporter DctP family solute receptor